MMEITQGGNILENHIDTRKYGNVGISFRPPVLELEKAWIEHYRSYPYLKNWKFHGLGIAVRDLDKTAEYYEMLDIIEFQSEIEGHLACTRCVDHCMNKECEEVVQGREAVCQKCIDYGKRRIRKYENGNE